MIHTTPNIVLSSLTPEAAFNLELQGHKSHLIVQRQQEMAVALFLLYPYTPLSDPMLLIHY